MTPPSLTDIAADIRKHSPGVLPDDVKDGGDALILFDQFGDDWVQNTPALSLILIAAMVMDEGSMQRRLSPSTPGWFAWRTGGGSVYYADSDHGGSLSACYAAWRWAKGLSPYGETGTNKENG